jgi:D-glycero-D-manno-heptose 1,7-bisphosphate phosphatase
VAIMPSAATGASRALFLDRDGVINIEKGYVYRIDDFAFVEGIFELGARAQSLGFMPIVITNQAGIGRGYYTEAEYQRITVWMLDQFRMRGIGIDRVYHCPFHPTDGIGEYRRESFDRKPNPGMILKAQSEFSLDLSRSVLVGDSDSDIEAGRAAGVGYNLKLLLDAHAGGAPERLEFTSLYAVGAWLGETFCRPSPG